MSLDAITETRRHTNVHRQTARLLLAANAILDEYRDTKVTVRQLYYQFVARGMIVNSAKSYSNFDRHLTTGRKHGVIDWSRIIDRARAVLAGDHIPTCDISDEDYADPCEEVREQIENVTRSRAYLYDLRKWHGQPNYVEVWTEKDALAGVLEPICQRLGVKLVIARGYCSYTFKMEGGTRLAGNGKRGIILYFGDLDPSGWNMCETLREDLQGVEVRKVALIPAQVIELPSNPVKEKDPRTPDFQKAFPQFKGRCWELDALAPDELRSLVRDSIAGCFDNEIEDKNKETVRKWRREYETELQRLAGKLDLSALDD